MNWWDLIDREEAIEAVRRLVPLGGCLVLSGDDLSGRVQAGALVAQALASFGYTVIRPEIGARPATLRRMLVEVWKVLAGPLTPEEVPPWVASAFRLSCQTLITEIRSLPLEENKTALLLEDPDRLEASRSQDVYSVNRLAIDVAWPVVITSNPSSGTNWDALEQPSRVLALRDFTETDVRQCLARTPELAHLDTLTLEEAVAAVMAGTDDVVRPLDAYTVLRAWGAR